MIYTSDGLISAIKRNAQFPSSQRKFEPDDFLAFLNEELQLTIVKELLEIQQDFWVEHEDKPLLASVNEYSFPDRAIGWKVNSVGYVSPSNVYTRLPHIARSNRGRYQNLQENSVPAGFYVEGNKVIFVPKISATPIGSVEFDFVRIQNKLVLTSACGLITSVTPVYDLSVPPVVVSYDITVDTLPNYSSGVDIMAGTNPFDTLLRKITPLSVTGTVFNFAVTDITTVPSLGDWVTATGTSCIPNIPEDFHPILAQAATIRCLIAQNDANGLKTAQISYGSMINTLKQITKERVDSSPIKVVSQSKILGMMR